MDKMRTLPRPDFWPTRPETCCNYRALTEGTGASRTAAELSALVGCPPREFSSFARGFASGATRTRQLDDEACARAKTQVQRNRSADCLDQPATDRKPEPSSLSDFFGGDERLEQAVTHRGSNARA